MPKASQHYNLQVINPNLAKEWHPTKNGSLTPHDVAPGSDKKVWWVCDKNHEWKTRVSVRSIGAGCPYCTNRKVSDDNCLQTLNPDLAKEWYPTKNGSLTPRNIIASSSKKVWWLCEKGHEWKVRVGERNKGSRCPYCSGNKVCDDNCLQTLNPDLAKEWHPTKNGSLTPRDVVPGSK